MKKIAQVWIETVLYMLIGIALLGVVLAFVMPRINEAKDRVVVEQSISALNVLDERINAVLQAPGNVRRVDFTLKRGQMRINPTEDEIILILSDLEKPYSEPGVEISIGRVKIESSVRKKDNSVSLKLDYKNSQRNPYIDIVFADRDRSDEKILDSAPLPYKLVIHNKGPSSDNSPMEVDITLIP